MRVSTLAVALCALLSSSLLGCTGGEPETLKIAVACPMSGSGAAFGEMISKAAQLKIDELNAAGGIGGKKLELVIEDDRGDTSEAANVARKLAGDGSVLAVVGHFNSTCSIAGREEYNRKGVVELSPGSTNVSVCKGAPWTFRNLYRDDYQGTFLARYAKESLGATKVAVFFDNDDYGKGLMEAFSAEAKALGLEVLEPIAYVRERTQDFKPLVAQAAVKKPDAIFIAGLYNEAALITKSARKDLGMEAPILAGDGVMNDKYIELAGDSADGTFVTTPFLFEAARNNEAASTFVKVFEAKYAKRPDTWAALTYDAIGQVADAIAKAGASRKAIKDHLAATTTKEKAYVGVTGLTYFDAEGDCYSKGAHVAVVRGKQFIAAERQLELHSE